MDFETVCTIQFSFRNYFIDYYYYGNKTKKLLSNVLSATSGDAHVILLGRNNELYAYGYNEYGVLGLGNDKLFYEVIRIPIDEPVISVKSGNLHTVALSMSHTVYVWGKIACNNTHCYYPTKLNVQNIISIFCGPHNMVLISTNKTYIDGEILGNCSAI